ncbi:hypothetical protein D3C80_768680 [compost metagenome]
MTGIWDAAGAWDKGEMGERNIFRHPGSGAAAIRDRKKRWRRRLGRSRLFASLRPG